MAMMFCGALAGLGGAVRVLSWFDSLRQSISGGIGFLALLIVMLAAYRILWVPFIAFFFSVVLNGSITLQLKTQMCIRDSMKILSGYQPPTGGEILLDGQPARFHSPADALAKGVGMLYQDPLDLSLIHI